MLNRKPYSEIENSKIRDHFFIIPQSPFILNGTLRKNLDFFNVFPDEALFHTLQHVGLINKKENIKCYLDSDIHDLSFSAGEKQSLIIARMILENKPIIILDEATSNMNKDLTIKTIDMINDFILNKNSSTTLIIISHQLTPLMSMDKVIVFDSGEIIETGQPEKLIKTTHSYFKNLFDN